MGEKKSQSVRIGHDKKLKEGEKVKSAIRASGVLPSVVGVIVLFASRLLRGFCCVFGGQHSAVLIVSFFPKPNAER